MNAEQKELMRDIKKSKVFKVYMQRMAANMGISERYFKKKYKHLINEHIKQSIKLSQQ